VIEETKIKAQTVAKSEPATTADTSLDKAAEAETILETKTEVSKDMSVETAYFAGGCFWGVEYAFSKITGVISVSSGYQQGHVENPKYRQVCSGTTGHVESVRVVFDSNQICFEQLCVFFFNLHDPSTLNR